MFTSRSQKLHSACDLDDNSKERERGKWYWRFEIENSLKRVDFIRFLSFLKHEDHVCRIKTLRKEVIKKYKTFKDEKMFDLELANKIFMRKVITH